VILGHCGRVSDANPAPPDRGDLRGIARGLRELFEIGARTMAEKAGPSVPVRYRRVR